MLYFELVTLSGTKVNEDVYEIQLPTPDGLIGIFEHHMPLVSLASPGIISVRKKQGDPDDFMKFFAVSGGVVDINGSTVRVLVDEADSDEELNEDDVKKAVEQAKNLREQAKDQVSLEHAQTMIQKQSTRLRVANMRRRKSR